MPNAVFKSSVYTPSVGQNVCTIRFLANGQAVDAGTNAWGTGAVPTGVSLHVWSPNRTTTTQSDIALHYGARRDRCYPLVGIRPHFIGEQ